MQVTGVVMPLVKAKQDVQYEQVTDAMKAFRAYDALRTARTDARQVGIRAKKAGEKKEADKDKAAKGGGKDDEVSNPLATGVTLLPIYRLRVAKRSDAC
jgi:hypothetical protein